MTQQLLTALIDRWAGQPILVLGGGRSVSKDLPTLKIAPTCVISANSHGVHQSRFPVDLIVNVDKVHCFLKQPMEKILRPLGIPIVNRHSWADYRIPDWTLAGNTGITSIAIACALGGNPIIVTGIDMWSEGRVYFHDDPSQQKPHKERRVRISVNKRDRMALTPLQRFAQGANIRPMSGPMCDMFKKYNPAEMLPPTQPIPYRSRLIAMKSVTVEATRPFRFSNMDFVSVGQRIVLSPKEADDARVLTNTRRVTIIS